MGKGGGVETVSMGMLHVQHMNSMELQLKLPQRTTARRSSSCDELSELADVLQRQGAKTADFVGADCPVVLHALADNLPE